MDSPIIDYEAILETIFSEERSEFLKAVSQLSEEQQEELYRRLFTRSSPPTAYAPETDHRIEDIADRYVRLFRTRGREAK